MSKNEAFGGNRGGRYNKVIKNDTCLVCDFISITDKNHKRPNLRINQRVDNSDTRILQRVEKRGYNIVGSMTLLHSVCKGSTPFVSIKYPLFISA